MYTRIVVPLDGSETAELALDRARTLCRTHDVPIHLVRIVDVAGTHSYSGFLAMERAGLTGAIEVEDADAGAYLERLRRRLNDEGLRVTSTTLRGHVVQQIVNFVRSGDLLIMTTHGKGRGPRWFLGRVADEVSRRCRVPIELVANAPAQTESLNLTAQEPGPSLGAI